MSAKKFDLNVAKKYRNITVVFQSNSVDVYLYDNKIVSIRNNNSLHGNAVVLNSCGWLTNTTKTAMNTALKQIKGLENCKVFQKKREWYVSLGDGTILEFKDGMRLFTGSVNANAA